MRRLGPTKGRTVYRVGQDAEINPELDFLDETSHNLTSFSVLPGLSAETLYFLIIGEKKPSIILPVSQRLCEEGWVISMSLDLDETEKQGSRAPGVWPRLGC